MSDEVPRYPLLVELYEQYLVDQKSAVFIDQVTRCYTIATLERLSESGGRLARRAAVLALGYMGDYNSNFALGRALIDSDRGVRTLAENSIRCVWRRVGDDQLRSQLDLVIRLNEAKRYEEAMLAATRLIHETPWLAEAWNQRTLARFNCGHYEESIRDCHQTLEINPYHFPAATGMGKCYLQLNNRIAALEAFRRALRLHPGLDDVRAHVVHLQRALKEE